MKELAIEEKQEPMISYQKNGRLVMVFMFIIAQNVQNIKIKNYE